jgi:hypothetical protein
MGVEPVQALEQLPEQITRFIRASVVAEYATVSAAGVPIDTPTYYFPSADFATLDLATGLAYPVKAERARRNPKVGLLIEGLPHEPVLCIAGHAAVRDADLQANAERYLAETSYLLPGGGTWDLGKRAIWYWARIIVCVTPVVIRWWENAAAMEGPPTTWTAPSSIVCPKSDPAPMGDASAPSEWARRPWQELADRALQRGSAGHITICDTAGYPLPIRARDIRVSAEGFDFIAPAGIPWPLANPATLTFAGVETFVGAVTSTLGRVQFRVARTLPLHPFMEDPTEVFSPSVHTQENLMRRLLHEAQRRNQPLPTLPDQLPEPSAGARLRMDRLQLEVERPSKR